MVMSVGTMDLTGTILLLVGVVTAMLLENAAMAGLALIPIVVLVAAVLRFGLVIEPMFKDIQDHMGKLAALIIAMVEQYVKADSRAQHRELSISVPEGMKEELTKNLLGRIKEQLDLAPTILVGKGTEGFTFSFGKEGDVVIDVESIMEAIKPFISQKFHELLQVGA